MIAPSFGDIFRNNSLKNGFLPIVLTEPQVDQLFYDAAAFPGFKLRIDLERQTVSTVDGAKSFHFDVDPFNKHSLLNGLDEIGLTLEKAESIASFEKGAAAARPWV